MLFALFYVLCVYISQFLLCFCAAFCAINDDDDEDDSRVTLGSNWQTTCRRSVMHRRPLRARTRLM